MSAEMAEVIAAPESLPISRATIDAFYERCTPGTIMECVDNTFRPAAIGIIGTVTQTTGKYVDLHLEETGKKGSIWRPRRVRDVTALTSETITTRLLTVEGTATWRIVPDPLAAALADPEGHALVKAIHDRMAEG